MESFFIAVPSLNGGTLQQIRIVHSGGLVVTVVRAQELLSLGGNINYHLEEVGSYTPLHYSARWGHNEVVAMLLKQPSIDINSCDENGETPLHRTATKTSKC